MIPSRIESVPLVLGDAIQSGTAVVVTDCGDMGRVVEQHGLGVLVPPEDASAMAEGIASALGATYPDPDGLERARSQFSVKEIVATLVERLRRP